MRTIVLVLFAMGCAVDSEPGPPARVDFFGEACVAGPYPAVTECHDGAGWCADGVCRPMCSEAKERCAAGVMRFTAGGACYCSPE